MIRKALIADDDDMDRELIKEGLNCLDTGIEVQVVCDGAQACQLADDEDFDIVFADLCMPNKDGIDVLKKFSSVAPMTEVVIVTGDGQIPNAVRAMKMGCFDYLQKPITVDEVEAVMTQISQHRRLVEEDNHFRAALDDKDDSELIGQCDEFKRICDRAMQVAPTNATVLLQGESGTGKELIARLVHQRSQRDQSAFIRVNCAALSESLLESELFGHTKGAFTGAREAKTGRFELADGGTLMLDEITETSEKLQAELLRVIEAKEFERVGGTNTIKVDVRIIATTNRDIEDEVAEGEFREDLYYRLNVVPIELPPLRNRKDDIPLLARYFARKFSKQLGRRCPELPDVVLDRMKGYSWPGNVRELQNVIQRILIMHQSGSIAIDHLPARLQSDGVGLSFASERDSSDRTLAEIERDAILNSIMEADGNKTRAADNLGISARTIWNKLKKYEADGVLPGNFA